MKGVRCISEQR